MNKLGKQVGLLPCLVLLLLSVGCGSDEAASPPSLASVKQSISDLRTWATATELEAKDQRSEFNLQLDNAGLMYDITGPLLDAAVGRAIDAGISAHNQASSIDNLQDFFVAPSLVQATGSAIVDITAGTVQVVGMVDAVVVDFTFTFPELSGTTFVVGIFGSAQNDEAILQFNSGSLTLNYGTTADLTPWLINGSKAPFPSFEQAIADADVVITEKASVASSIRFVGTLSAEVLAAKDSAGIVIDPITNEAYYNPRRFNMTGIYSSSIDDFVTETNSYSGSMNAEMTNADTFVPLAPTFIAGRDYEIATYLFSNSGNTVTIDVPNQVNYIATFLPSTGSVMVTQTFPLSEPYTYNSFGTYTSLLDYLTTSPPLGSSLWIDGQGYYQVNFPTNWLTPGGILIGSLMTADTNQAEENSLRYRKLVNLSISFVANLSGLPEATISMEGNRSGFEDGTATLTIAYDNAYIIIRGSAVAGVGNLTAAISDGNTIVNLVIGENDTISIVSGSTVYGTLVKEPDTQIWKITYSDGTFEIL